MNKIYDVKTIPDLLVDTFGNQSELARRLGINRATLRKFIKDKDGKQHAIVNGVFMSATFESVSNVYENVPTLLSQQNQLRHAESLRTWHTDIHDEHFKRLICKSCLNPFGGDEVREVCRQCNTPEHTAALRRLVTARRKIRCVR
ncbi:DNA binding protein [Erwinia phage AH03]|uniref:Protein ninH n=1 Tax=Erwinia phage AH03 TaxID=2869568 RepID=A0AAE7X0M8_9CAUD|nr:DNA binding protein [Erwinia phage AH03]